MTRVQNTIARNFKRYLMATALTATGLLAVSPAFADNWTDHVADQPGGISIDTSVPNTTNIQQHLDTVTVRGDGDINAGWTVNVAQPSNTSRYILFDIENDPTFIRGNLNANGEIYIFDQNGVIFGDTAIVNVGSIVASTGTIADMNTFLEGGKLTLENVAPGAKVINNGMITAGEAGLVGLVAEGVENNGIINAKVGKVALASGNKVTLDLYGDNLVEIAVDGAMENALVSNAGVINAEGGTVSLAASAAKSAVENVINMDGIVDVSSATVKGGQIILSGGNQGTVKVSGKLDASGKTGGGKINVKGENVVATNTSAFVADAKEQGDGGRIDLIAQNHMDYSGNILARGGATEGNGGFAEVSGYTTLGFDGDADLSAAHGEMGNLLLDPDFAIIYSGVIDKPFGLNYVLSAQALANVMKKSGLTIQANNFIDVGLRAAAYNTGNGTVDAILNGLLGTGNIDMSTYYGSLFSGCLLGCTTEGTLSFQTDVLNFNKDLKIGKGNVNIIANGVNLNGVLTGHDDALLGDNRISSNANIVSVLSPKAKIQQGIWMANDAGGASINVGAGLFNESLTIGKSLTLNGANAGKAGNDATRGNETIIDPNSPGMVITADNVTVDGVTITDTSGADGYGIHVDNADNTTIRNSIIKNTSEAGIYAVNANTLNIHDNVIKDTAAGWGKGGINISGGSAITIADNELTNNGGHAIYAEGPYAGPATQLDITGNTITNAQFNGIYIKKWNGADIEGNTINGVNNGGHGVQLELTNNTDVLNNTISNASGAGINLRYGNDTTKIQQNTLTDNKYGVSVPVAEGANSNTTIGDTLNPTLGNTITGGTTGVLVQGGNNLVVASNTISSQSDAGIDIKNAAGAFNIVYFNKVNDTGNDGIRVLNTHSVLLADNRVGVVSPVGGNGIFVTTSDNAQILSNIVGGAAKDGIKTEGGQNLSVTGNTVYGTGLMGINVNKAKGATITSNAVYGTGDDAIVLTNASKTLVVSRNTIGKAGVDGQVKGNGIYIFNSHGALVQRNTITNINVVNQALNDYNGIHIARSNNTLVGGVGNGNTITGARDGIKIEGGTDNDVVANIVTSSKRIGIFAEATYNTDILFNTVFDSNLSGFGGITVAGGTNHTAQGNTVSDLATSKSKTGIYFYDVTDGANVIKDNVVHDISGIGIKAEKVNNLTVENNTIKATKDDGIAVLNSKGTILVNGNTIGAAGAKVAGNGIRIFNSHGAVIQSNKISNIDVVDESADDYNGIYIDRSNNTVVGGTGGKGNIINGARDGIKISGATNTDVIANNIGSSKRIGIFSEASFGTDILFNTVFNSNLSGFGGITIAGGTDHSVKGNTVSDLGSSKATSGIYLYDITGGTNVVSGNNVRNINGVGIKVEKVRNADILKNTVGNTKDDAILVSLSKGAININDNVIGTTGPVSGNGIFVDRTMGVSVLRNKISNINVVNQAVNDYNGIYFYNSNNGTVVDNTITGARDGIKMASGSNHLIQGNTVSNSARIGIFVEPADTVRILDNTVFNSNLKSYGGITVLGGKNVTITGNEVSDIIGTSKANAGIYVGKLTGGVNTITNNTVFDINGNGIDVRSLTTNIDIVDNVIDDVTTNGIYLNGVQSAKINGNDITSSGLNGLYAAGATNGNIIVSGNAFTDNPTGANFESGVIDFTAPSPNFFVRGNVGLRFAPFALGTPLSLVDDDAAGVQAFDPGFVTPANYGGTIGAQNFEGQAQYYVQLENGAFYNPGTPTWLNGLNSTYDAFTPSIYGPDYIIPSTDLDNLNAKFYHYPNGLLDGKNLGVFFYGRLAQPVGPAPLAGEIEQSLIFNTFGAFNGDATGLNIQIRGLPSIPGGSTAASLNNLVPFAGGATASNTAANLNTIETAAGETTPAATSQTTTTASAENLSDIETASGAQEQACWGEAAAMAGNGMVVNVVYGGSMDDSLEQAAACGGSI